MASIKKQKKVEKIAEYLNSYHNLLLINLKKTTHQQLENIRKSLSEYGKILVIKNSLYQKAFNKYYPSKKIVSQVQKNFFPIKNQNAVIFFQNNWAEGLQKIYQLIKENSQITFSFGIFDKEIYNQDNCQRIAQLPSKSVLYAQLISQLKSPIFRLINTLTSPHKKFLYLIKNQSNKVNS